MLPSEPVPAYFVTACRDIPPHDSSVSQLFRPMTLIRPLLSCASGVVACLAPRAPRHLIAVCSLCLSLDSRLGALLNKPFYLSYPCLNPHLIFVCLTVLTDHLLLSHVSPRLYAPSSKRSSPPHSLGLLLRHLKLLSAPELVAL